MSQNNQQAQPPQVSQRDVIKGFFTGDAVKKRFQEVLGKKANAFITSVLNSVTSSKDLSECDVQSIYSAAATAAELDLPVNKDLGFSAIIPYKDKNRGGMQVAQFQIMWKGFVQLAQRTERFETINVEDVRDGELIGRDRLTGICEFKWIQSDAERIKLPVIGYVAYFSLKNGFKKSIYRTVDELTAHAQKYSNTYNRSDSKWHTDTDAMCRKTVIKELLSKWGPLETDASLALGIKADQSVSMKEGEFTYPDNPVVDGEAVVINDTENRADKLNAAAVDALNAATK